MPNAIQQNDFLNSMPHDHMNNFIHAKDQVENDSLISKDMNYLDGDLQGDFVNSAVDESYMDHEVTPLTFQQLRNRLIVCINKLVYDRIRIEDFYRNQIKGTVGDLQYWKNVQAITRFGAGITAGLAGISSALPLNEIVKGVFEALSKATPLFGDTAYTFVEGKSVPLAFEKDEYINTSSLDKQKQQQLNDLKKELQQDFMEITRLKLQMYRLMQLSQ